LPRKLFAFHTGFGFWLIEATRTLKMGTDRRIFSSSSKRALRLSFLAEGIAFSGAHDSFSFQHSAGQVFLRRLSVWNPPRLRNHFQADWGF
jgi:hypothetical protein